MESSLSATTLRIVLIVIGALILAGIYWLGRTRRPGSGRRLPFRQPGAERVEPVWGDAESGAPPRGPASGDFDLDLLRELERLDAAPGAAVPDAGDWGTAAIERIVSLHVVARGDDLFHGNDIMVAAEKAGLEYGSLRIFHRLPDGRGGQQPVFSMVNLVKPGFFDLQRASELTTPGVTFFATLPGPLAALDAWDAMLPAAQRIAELLDGELLDPEHNALGRQRIAGLREELRAWDRQHEVHAPQPPRRR